MKATLNFDLDNHEDRLSHKRAINATNAYLVIWTMQNKVFRNILKYNGDSYSEETLLAIEELRSKFFNLVEEYEINLNDLE